MWENSVKWAWYWAGVFGVFAVVQCWVLLSYGKETPIGRLIIGIMFP